MVRLARRPEVPAGDYVIRNDVTKEPQLFKVSKVYHLEKT
jgi:hypothetical protein